jgi:aspartate kinase
MTALAPAPLKKIVQKYGGTSVGTPERIRAVAAHIAETIQRGNLPIVVVSAMGSTTDDLIALAHEVSQNPSHREMDMLLTVGERISMALLSMALNDLGIQAISLTGSQSGIITSPSHRRARIQNVLGQRIREALLQNKVPIVAGFQGVSPEKEITTLGRGGSDTSAVALAIALEADHCEIYTDVDGIYSADPREVTGTHFYETIPDSVMTAYALGGASVLHPRCCLLAQKYSMPVSVHNSGAKKNTSPSFSGTRILPMSQFEGMEFPKVYGVTRNDARFLIRFDLPRNTSFASLMSEIETRRLSMFQPLLLEKEGVIYGEKEFLPEWRLAFDKLTRDEFMTSYTFLEHIIPVTVAGVGLSQNPEVVRKASECLNGGGFEVLGISIGPESVTFAIPASKSEDAVQLLHDTFLK